MAKDELSRLEGDHPAEVLGSAEERGKASELDTIIDSLPDTLEEMPVT